MAQIDLTPFLCEAFSSNPKIYKAIEEIYLQNRLAYYRLAKESSWYTHEILTCQSIEKEIVMKRALGILLEGDTEKILLIIKKGWKSIYNQIKNQQEIKASEILYQMIPKTKTGQDRITNDELNSYAMVIIMLAVLLEKDLDEEDDVYLIFDIPHYPGKIQQSVHLTYSFAHLDFCYNLIYFFSQNLLSRHNLFYFSIEGNNINLFSGVLLFNIS
jgi:hypothetical protein